MTLYLRVDIDFNICLKKGGPFLLHYLKTIDSQVSFFVVMGPDSLFEHGIRVKQKKYRRRLRSCRFHKLARHIAWPYLESLLTELQVGPAYPDILRRIVAEGHELAVHGYNHARWADCIFEMEPKNVRKEMD